MALASVCLSVRLSVRLSTKLVDTIQTEPFELGPSNLVHILLMTRGRTLLIFKVRVKGQGHTLDIVHKACRHDTDWTVWARTVKLGTHTTYDKRTNPIDFQGQGSKGQGHTLDIVHKACRHDTDWTVWARTVKLGTHTTYDKRTNPIDFQGQGSKVKVTC